MGSGLDLQQGWGHAAGMGSGLAGMGSSRDARGWGQVLTYAFPELSLRSRLGRYDLSLPVRCTMSPHAVTGAIGDREQSGTGAIGDKQSGTAIGDRPRFPKAE